MKPVNLRSGKPSADEKQSRKVTFLPRFSWSWLINPDTGKPALSPQTLKKIVIIVPIIIFVAIIINKALVADQTRTEFNQQSFNALMTPSGSNPPIELNPEDELSGKPLQLDSSMDNFTEVGLLKGEIATISGNCLTAGEGEKSFDVESAVDVTLNKVQIVIVSAWEDRNSLAQLTGKILDSDLKDTIIKCVQDYRPFVLSLSMDK